MIGQENESLRIFIKAANRKNALAVINEITNVIALAFFHGGNDTDGFIEHYKYQVFCISCLNKLTVDFHRITDMHLIAYRGAFTIDENVALFNVTIGITARANPTFTDVFIQAC